MTSRLVSLLKLGGSRLFPKRKLRIFQVITPTSGVFSSSSSSTSSEGRQAGPWITETDEQGSVVLAVDCQSGPYFGNGGMGSRDLLRGRAGQGRG